MGAQRNEDGFSEEIINIIGESDYVVSESRGKKTTPDGSQYNNEYLFIYRLEDNKIKEWRCYLDTQLLSDTHT
jgi:ketosteroid isomerase-like protein